MARETHIATVKKRLMDDMCNVLKKLGICENEIALLDYGLLTTLIEINGELSVLVEKTEC